MYRVSEQVHGIRPGQVTCCVWDDLRWHRFQIDALQVIVASNFIECCNGEDDCSNDHDKGLKSVGVDYSSQATCNSVESSDDQHEDSGEVEIPAQTNLDKQSSRVQIRLVSQVTTLPAMSPSGLTSVL